MDVAILFLTALGVALAFITVLPLLGLDIRIFGRSEMATEVKVEKNGGRKKLWPVFVVLGINLLISTGAFCYFFRPRIVEKIVWKPVDRVVEKIVQTPCPKPTLKSEKSTKHVPVAAPVAQSAQPIKPASDLSNGIAPTTSQSSAEIKVDNGSNNNTFSGNRFINVQKVGITASGNSSGNVFTDNTILQTKDQPSVPYQQLPKYKNVTNKTLHDEVIDFANDMRTFDSDFEANYNSAHPPPSDPRPAVSLTPEEIHKLSVDRAKQFSQMDKDLSLQISKNYLGQATEYRNEMVWRLKAAGMQPQESGTDLLNTFWPMPGEEELSERSVTGTATYLENLARQLP